MQNTHLFHYIRCIWGDFKNTSTSVWKQLVWFSCTASFLRVLELSARSRFIVLLPLFLHLRNFLHFVLSWLLAPVIFFHSGFGYGAARGLLLGFLWKKYANDFFCMLKVLKKSVLLASLPTESPKFSQTSLSLFKRWVVLVGFACLFNNLIR